MRRALALTALLFAVLRADGRSADVAALTAVLLAMNPYLFGFNVYNMVQLGDVIAQLAHALHDASSGTALPSLDLNLAVAGVQRHGDPLAGQLGQQRHFGRGPDDHQ